MRLVLAMMFTEFVQWLGRPLHPISKDLELALPVMVSATWAIFDARRIRLRDHATSLSWHPVFFWLALVCLWPVMFPWYLVIRAGLVRGEYPLRQANPRMPIAAIVVVCVLLGALLDFIPAVLLAKKAAREATACPSLISVVVPTFDIAPGELITWNLLSKRAVAASFVGRDTIPEEGLDWVLGRRPRIRLIAGDPLRWSALYTYRESEQEGVLACDPTLEWPSCHGQ